MPGIDVLQSFASATERAPADAARWREETPQALIHHLVERYHQPLDGELERLDALAVRVLAVHGARERERLSRLLATLRLLSRILEGHLAQEERVLFPWILAGHSPAPVAPIRVMQQEHAQLDECLAQLRALTDGYVPPEGACRTWRALWEGLARLEGALDAHTWLEDEVLFPRVLEDDGR